VRDEWQRSTVFPPAGCIFEALNACPLSHTCVVIVGQDPYHGRNQACGLAFSVSPGVPVPSSLRNILRELRDDLGIDTPAQRGGDLRRWAASGVLLLNAVLTVREGEANSHAGHGWEQLTDAAISAVAHELDGLVFILWGRQAAAKGALVPPGRGHVVLTAPHPSGLSAHRGFFGSRPFSKANAALLAHGAVPVDWRL
jgi:uracil-DNA glycosylase